MIRVAIGPVPDLDALGERWRALESRAEPSFFQSWTWTGCLAQERFDAPVLAEATENGRTVALALFNRRNGRLHLGESGDPARDCPYIEQNGVLAESGRTLELTAALLRPVARRHPVVLSGIGAPTLAAARQAAPLVWVRRTQPSPFADLAAVRAAGGDCLATRSANTRQQIRRSARYYGALSIERAGTVPAALAALDRLADLHQAAWQARGQPGAFAPPFFRRFHRALIERAMPRGEAELLTIKQNDAIIGILYNFIYVRCVLAYQSGFHFANDARDARPGLVCHTLAMNRAMAQGIDKYDFLAGEGRYKRSLCDAEHTQAWAEAGPLWSVPLLARRLVQSIHG